MTVKVRTAKPAEVIDLRHAVLRAGLPRQTAVFAGDDDPAALHWVAEEDGAIVGCATLHLNQWEHQAAWQLRGMAVDPARQRCGIGAALLDAIDRFVSTSPSKLLWCNARVSAAKFYEKHGWRIVSDVFEIPIAGPHVKMIKDLQVPE